MLQALKSLIALGALGCLAVHVVRFALALDDREWARLKHYAWMMFGVSALALSSIGIWPFLVIVCFFVHRFGRDLQPAVLLACGAPLPGAPGCRRHDPPSVSRH